MQRAVQPLNDGEVCSRLCAAAPEAAFPKKFAFPEETRLRSALSCARQLGEPARQPARQPQAFQPDVSTSRAASWALQALTSAVINSSAVTGTAALTATLPSHLAIRCIAYVVAGVEEAPQMSTPKMLSSFVQQAFPLQLLPGRTELW